jgi:hypothetical protein
MPYKQGTNSSLPGADHMTPHAFEPNLAQRPNQHKTTD